MREVTISVWCDACRADDMQTLGQTIRLTIGHTVHAETLDLCEKHQAALIEPLAQLLADYGTPIDADGQPMVRPKPRTPRTSDTKMISCPACDAVMVRNSLPPHIYKKHLKIAPPVLTACPECGWTPPMAGPTAPRAVGAHRGREHEGAGSIKDALDALAAVEADKAPARKARAST
jgi:hypothetical protein